MTGTGSTGPEDPELAHLDTAAAPPTSQATEAESDDVLKAAVRSRLFPGRAPTAHIGRFKILQVLGEGGMGTVLTAYDDQLDRRVAIKVIKGPSGGGARARMLREAQAMARLSHPNVVTIYDVGEHERQLFVAMEYVRGQTLSAWQEDDHSLAEVVSAYLQAGRGLVAAHDRGLVHRDFKPHNAMVDDEGRVRVLDFGLASRRDEVTISMRDSTVLPPPAHHALDTPLTETGAVMGTPAYMSPEQFTGGAVDARSDQFSFCVALWEAVYGNRPFAGLDTTALFTAIAQQAYEPTTREGVPQALTDALHRGLQPKPEDRWPSLEALLDALTPFAAQENRSAPLVRRVLHGTLAVAIYGVLLLGTHTAWAGEVGSRNAAAGIAGIAGGFGVHSIVALWRGSKVLEAQTGRGANRNLAAALLRSPLAWVLILLFVFVFFFVDFTGTRKAVPGSALRGLPLLLVMAGALWAARHVVPARGGVFWSALLGLATFSVAMLLGGELLGVGLEHGIAHIGALTAFLAAGLTCGVVNRRLPTGRSLAVLAGAIIGPMLIALALRGPGIVGSTQPVRALPTRAVATPATALDRCDCPECVLGSVGPSLSDVDVFRVRAEGSGFSELRVGLASSEEDALSVTTYDVARLPPPTLLRGGERLSLVVGRPVGAWSFTRQRYCLAIESVELPTSESLSIASGDAPRIVSVEWTRDGEVWLAHLSGTADTASVIIEVPRKLPVDVEGGSAPFRSILDPHDDRRLHASVSVAQLSGLSARLVAVDGSRWRTTIRLQDPEPSAEEVPDTFRSAVIVRPSRTSDEGALQP